MLDVLTNRKENPFLFVGVRSFINGLKSTEINAEIINFVFVYTDSVETRLTAQIEQQPMVQNSTAAI